MNTAELALETRDLTKVFGGLVAVDGVNFCLAEGELRCIVGTNGAGKTTLFNLITGALPATSGEVLWQGSNISRMHPHQICRLGIGRKFQVPNVFRDLSVADNIRVAASGKVGLFALMSQTVDREFEEELPTLLSRIRLYEKREAPASSLSHGEQQWLEIGMVLASRPRLLLLDEPTAGMTGAETQDTVRLIKDIAAEVTTVVIAHDIGFVRALGGRVTVMYRGRILVEGSLEEVERHETVRDVYLGREAA